MQNLFVVKVLHGCGLKYHLFNENVHIFIFLYISYEHEKCERAYKF